MGQTGGGTDGLGDLFYPLYQRLFGEDTDLVAEIETKLAEARMPETAELFLSKSLGIGVITGILFWVVGTTIAYGIFALGLIDTSSLIGLPVGSESTAALINAVKIPVAILVSGVFFGAIGFTAGFGLMVLRPYSEASTRRREINMLLPDAISFMYALSIGGLNQLEILEAIANADDTYGEVSYEFQTIVQETEYFDTDYRTAIRNRAMETPSEDLSQFYIDMLSIINSGGDMVGFLNDKKEKHLRTAKQEQERTLETLELFGEMYMTLSLFPLLLIIILVIMGILGEAPQILLYGTVYVLIPMTGIAFLVLVSTVKEDEPGDGYLYPEAKEEALNKDPGLINMGLVERYVGEFSVFDRIKRREGTYETINLLREPHLFFREHPMFILGLTIPASLVLVGSAALGGVVPLEWQGMIDQPVWSTFMLVYLPLYINFIPLMIFREWNIRSRKRIISKLSDNLRKLSSANDTGLTLLESFKTVADTTPGKLGDEFAVMYAKVNYGTNLRNALLEFNNKYHIPRLARTVKLIAKAQEASSQITDVLRTAAQVSENQDDISRERKSRTRMQVAIILMTYFTLLAVMAILKTQFLDVMAGVSDQAASSGGSGGQSQQFASGINTSLMSLLFFHAVTMQAILSGMISGYIRDAKLLSGIKFVVPLATVALVVWMVVG